MVPLYEVLQLHQTLLEAVPHQLPLQLPHLSQLDPQHPTLLHNFSFFQRNGLLAVGRTFKDKFLEKGLASLAYFVHVVPADEFDSARQQHIEVCVGHIALVEDSLGIFAHDPANTQQTDPDDPVYPPEKRVYAI